MAKNQVDISTNERLQLNGDSINSGTIDRKFGRPEDFIELHIYNQQNQLLISDYNFTQYKFPEGATENLVSELNMDPVNVLRLKGYTSGQYKLVFNIQRSKIFNTFNPPFAVKEISSTRRELRAITPKLTNEQLDPEASRFIREIDAAAYLKDFVLNFNDDINIVGVNLALNKNTNKYEILFKLIDPLPSDIKLSDSFRVVEEITDPIILNVDLGLETSEDEGVPLQGPNFKIDVRLNNSVPSSFKNFDEVLDYSLTSSYHNLLSHLENREIPDISYDFIRTVSGSNEGDPLEEVYHFENFTHFSSAVERLKNFEYKIQLIELYDSQTTDINSITGDTADSTYVLENKEAINEKKQNLIKGFDGYERFLYYTSGTFAWPKQDPGTSPYTLYPVTSSQVKTWLGDERDSFPNYGGQLLSASQFDRQNENALTRLVPNHITDNPDNSFYSSFVNMVGQHFDQIWVHIKHLTEINDAHHSRGISKELVYFSLKSLGLETFDQFENSNLIEYILGEGTSGSVFYDTPQSQSMVTASNAGSIPKSDITKNIWKRLYHNAPYLLKTKGTERGLRALMSCYGIPSTILNVKEYGGSTSDKTTYKTFTNDKSGLALKGDSGTGGNFIQTDWSSSLTKDLNSEAKTVEFRIKPHRSNDKYHLWSLSGSYGTDSNVDQHLTLEPYTGNDISSSGDANQYGRIVFSTSNNTKTTPTEYFPIFNGDFWNVFVGTDAQGKNDSDILDIKFGAYQANYNKNIHSYVTSSTFKTKTNNSYTWGITPSNSSNVVLLAKEVGAAYCYIGGLPSGEAHNNIDGLRYSGSIQEVRYHFGELLSHETLKKHALEPFMYAGNTVSSSYENLILRLPLGSNDKRDSGSFHPNINVNYLGGGTSSMTTQTWEEVIEEHYTPTPDTVGISTTSEKTRIDTGTIDDDWLSLTRKTETSTLDNQPPDYEDLGVFFSPTNELNEDIIYTLGAFRLDDYIGSPLPDQQKAFTYKDLSTIKDIYFKKVERRYNYWDYIKLIQYIDHTLFKLVEQWVPMKANLKTGLLIEPHYLERTKFARELPSIDQGQSMVNGSYNTINSEIEPNRQFNLNGSSVIITNNLSDTTDSKGQRKEQGTNVTIDIDDYILDKPQSASQAPVGRTSSTLLGNATKGRLSRRYYRKLTNGKETEY